MKILSNRLYLSAFGVFMVLVICVFYLFAAVLKQPLTSRPLDLTVQLTSAGGLFEGSAVTYRGVKVGKVTDIELTSSGVAAHLRLSAGTEVPEDSLAVVRSLSPVGEQYLDFQPNSAGGPFLESGDSIPAESTDIPKSLQSTVVAVNNVLRQVDEDNLRTTLVELSKALDGTGDELGRMIDDGSCCSRSCTASTPRRRGCSATVTWCWTSPPTRPTACAGSALRPRSSRLSCATTIQNYGPR